MKLRYLYAHYIQTDHGLYSHILNICYYGNQTVLPPGDLFYVCVNIDNWFSVRGVPSVDIHSKRV